MSKTMKEMYEEVREEGKLHSKPKVDEILQAIQDFNINQLDKIIIDEMKSSKQVGGSHYQLTIEPWDYISANNIGYLEGNVIKYVSRYKDKNGKQDLEKAIHYLEKLIEVNYGNTN